MAPGRWPEEPAPETLVGGQDKGVAPLPQMQPPVKGCRRLANGEEEPVGAVMDFQRRGPRKIENSDPVGADGIVTDEGHVIPDSGPARGQVAQDFVEIAPIVIAAYDQIVRTHEPADLASGVPAKVNRDSPCRAP